MTASMRRQATLLALCVLAGGIGVGVGHWRRMHPEIALRLESFDHVPPTEPVPAPARPWTSAHPAPRSTDSRAGSDADAPGERPSAIHAERRPDRGGRRAEGATRTAPPAARVDLNRATLDELARLPGVGPVLAASILASRESRGPFASVDDLRWVRGVGPTRLERLRPLVVVAP